MPEEQKGKCPVCNITIECKESVRVSRAHDRVDLESDKKVREEIDIGWRQELIAKEKMKEGLNPSDVALILYRVNLNESLDRDKERISFLLASGTQAVTNLHLDRLIFFLTHMPEYRDDNTARKIANELHAFNVWRGTNFSLRDLGMAVSSPKDLAETIRLAEFLKRSGRKFPIPEGFAVGD